MDWDKTFQRKSLSNWKQHLEQFLFPPSMHLVFGCLFTSLSNRGNYPQSFLDTMKKNFQPSGLLDSAFPSVFNGTPSKPTRHRTHFLRMAKNTKTPQNNNKTKKPKPCFLPQRRKTKQLKLSQEVEFSSGAGRQRPSSCAGRVGQLRARTLPTGWRYPGPGQHCLKLIGKTTSWVAKPFPSGNGVSGRPFIQGPGKSAAYLARQDHCLYSLNNYAAKKQSLLKAEN